MITYHNKCTNCSHEFDIQKSIKEKFNNFCPECKQETLERVIHSPISFVREDITDKTTLGRLADKNTNKMGKYELQEKREKTRQDKIKGQRIAQEEMAKKTGKSPLEIPDKEPWYRKNGVGTKKINEMTPTQKEKYIRTGRV